MLIIMNYIDIQYVQGVQCNPTDVIHLRIIHTILFHDVYTFTETDMTDIKGFYNTSV
jgi:fido (protein-threonine AMPylation protein)